jgi:uncharacterized protein (TIGR00730 family)
MKRLCLFCGSNEGRSPLYRATAEELGRTLAERGLGLVFGGGRVGLMGAAADAALAGGGEVIGIIPEAIVDLEVAHQGLSDLRVVPSMHERKQLMHDLSDGFVTLPGGHGTFDEVFESITWLQLGYHTKPIVLLNLEGYYDPLLAMLDRATGEGFVKPEVRSLWLVDDSVSGALAQLEAWEAPDAQRWLRRSDL